jgi:vacuolar-type H+-ATPase subunit D/Vma8
MKLKFEASTAIAFSSLILSAASLVWIGGFRMSTLIHEVQDLKVDVQKLEEKMEKRFEKVDDRFEKVDVRFEKIENRLERIEDDFHKIDIRVNTLEQAKP